MAYGVLDTLTGGLATLLGSVIGVGGALTGAFLLDQRNRRRGEQAIALQVFQKTAQIASVIEFTAHYIEQIPLGRPSIFLKNYKDIRDFPNGVMNLLEEIMSETVMAPTIYRHASKTLHALRLAGFDLQTTIPDEDKIREQSRLANEYASQLFTEVRRTSDL